MEPKITEKAWNPELEHQVLKKWEESGLYDFVLKENNYTIDTPPPYPSGRPWHIGAASHYSQIDMIARTARMAGKNVYFPYWNRQKWSSSRDLHRKKTQN